jgi:hypothetical protein
VWSRFLATMESVSASFWIPMVWVLSLKSLLGVGPVPLNSLAARPQERSRLGIHSRGTTRQSTQHAAHLMHEVFKHLWG